MCKYCDEYMDIPVEVFRTYHDNNANIKVYIEWHGLHIECDNYAEAIVKIEFCPMCGKKLK